MLLAEGPASMAGLASSGLIGRDYVQVPWLGPPESQLSQLSLPAVGSTHLIRGDNTALHCQAHS
jgi:hypothetical protein